MRVVFDTNVFVSALTLPTGSAARALDRVVHEGHRLFVSRPLVDEVLGVLARKFSRDREELARVAVFLHEIGDVVRPRRRIRALPDPDDDRILECAVAARADVLVTGDKAMLRLRSYGSVRIVSIAEFLALE